MKGIQNLGREPALEYYADLVSLKYITTGYDEALILRWFYRISHSKLIMKKTIHCCQAQATRGSIFYDAVTMNLKVPITKPIECRTNERKNKLLP